MILLSLTFKKKISIEYMCWSIYTQKSYAKKLKCLCLFKTIITFQWLYPSLFFLWLKFTKGIENIHKIKNKCSILVLHVHTMYYNYNLVMIYIYLYNIYMIVILYLYNIYAILYNEKWFHLCCQTEIEKALKGRIFRNL